MKQQGALAMAILCACAFLASAGDLLDPYTDIVITCQTDDSSPLLNDAIDASASIDVNGHNACCQSNLYPFGSHCTTFTTAGGAAVGLCDDVSGFGFGSRACIYCDVLVKYFYDVIDRCTDSSHGGTKVGGTLSGLWPSLGKPFEDPLKIILFRAE